MVAVGPALAVVLILLAVTAIAVAYIGRTGYGSRIGWAVVRATVQLILLGGASPAAAAAMQLLVLVAILCCGSIAALLVCRYVAQGWYGQFRPDASSPPADSG